MVSVQELVSGQALPLLEQAGQIRIEVLSTNDELRRQKLVCVAGLVAGLIRGAQITDINWEHGCFTSSFSNLSIWLERTARVTHSLPYLMNCGHPCHFGPGHTVPRISMLASSMQVVRLSGMEKNSDKMDEAQVFPRDGSL